MADRRIIENDILRIEVCDVGAELQVIYDKGNERSVLWDGDPDFWDRHSPVLFPIVGALQDGTYRYKGDSYELPQHGFARDMEFELVELDERKMVHKLSADEETLKMYPFQFTLLITHELDGNMIQVSWKVVNEQQEEMYFSIGAHPAFRVPADEGSLQKEHYLEFPQKSELEYYRINDDGCVKEESSGELNVTNGNYLIGEQLFESGVLIFKKGQCDVLGIAFPDETNLIKIECAGFPYAGIWTKPGAPFICLEPWYGVADEVGFSGDISEKEGIQKLSANQAFHASYKIIIR